MKYGDISWVNNFITKEKDTFVAWDEVQANEIGRFFERDDAVKRVLLHALQLEKERRMENGHGAS